MMQVLSGKDNGSSNVVEYASASINLGCHIFKKVMLRPSSIDRSTAALFIW